MSDRLARDQGDEQLARDIQEIMNIVNRPDVDAADVIAASLGALVISAQLAVKRLGAVASALEELNELLTPKPERGVVTTTWFDHG